MSAHSPREIIRDAIRFDHNVTGNVDRIIEALHAAGYKIVPRHVGAVLPETTRVYGSKAVETRG